MPSISMGLWHFAGHSRDEYPLGSEFCLRPLRPFRPDAANISVRCPEEAPLIGHTFKRIGAVFF
jgi:hypothetical protein